MESLKKYVDQPSGSHDQADVAKAAELFAEDFQSLGFETALIPGKDYGPVLKAFIGTGEKQLMLMGHMDTVFPRAVYVPFTDLGNGKALGSGSIDMKGGDVVMLYALQKALPKLDLSKVRVCVVLNPDEEVGSPESHDVILKPPKPPLQRLALNRAAWIIGLPAPGKALPPCALPAPVFPATRGRSIKSAPAPSRLCAPISPPCIPCGTIRGTSASTRPDFRRHGGKRGGPKRWPANSGISTRNTSRS
jgi:hypothetical protein